MVTMFLTRVVGQVFTKIGKLGGAKFYSQRIGFLCLRDTEMETQQVVRYP